MKKIERLINNNPVLQSSRNVIRGYNHLKQLRKQFGEDAFIFLCRGKTGDIFLYFRFLPAFIEQRGITNYILTGDCKGLNTILDLYPGITGKCVPTSEREGAEMQAAYCFFGPEKLNMALSLMWDVCLPFNRCAVRLKKEFNFIDSYYWFLFDLDREKAAPTIPTFKPLSNSFETYLKKAGIIKGKTVIMSPYAYCVKLIPPMFWRLLSRDLKNRGYKVLVMLDERYEKNEFDCKSIFFKYQDAASVLEYAGHFIGLRSGFCDIISSVKCNKVILYPKIQKKIDYNNHRADLAYSGLKEMELSYDAHDVVLPFAQDIASTEPLNEDFETNIAEKAMAFRSILQYFPTISSKRK